MAMKRVLFICTGNFYRSRFAEAVFNHHASEAGISWKAESRGLATNLAPGNISSHATCALQKRGIDLKHTAEMSSSLSKNDLENSEKKIALKKAEHLPMIQETFPEWKDCVEYWDTGDVDVLSPEEALDTIERRVQGLVQELAAGNS